MSGSQGLLRAFLRLWSKEVKQYVGTDQFGNKYYYIPERKNWLGQTMRERRFMEASNMKEVDYREGDIPMEWEAWIRKTRKSPPTTEEIMKNEKYREDVQIKIKDVSEEENLQITDSKEMLAASPVHTKIKGHASAPDFGKSEPSEDPTSTGKTFQPGSWMPQESRSQNK
ncbi:NADH dehydrogenase [ubiquinone] 1 alpha subcomplex assembly factor 2 [Trichosurus vulpecula]|uniref:NADH dehydrogenase [ubiquinone] 1 alpha subcomplex assembly factor 2 n=1 Tax=Trichosurus vulpecula TaxID=9337 RepID=UPI00186B1486|nr:NADH dehydrogenase [ubiquinone] 1 alpha subcomplex assembly factor 2 [Trichosurus vulpecula]